MSTISKLASNCSSSRASSELALVDGNEKIANVEELIEGSIGPTVTLKLELSANACCVMTEAHQLKLALVNLYINARDAMPGDGGAVISTERHGPRRCSCEVQRDCLYPNRGSRSRFAIAAPE